MLLALLLPLSSVAFGSDQPASCEIASKSIVSRSSSEVAQVRNLGGVQIKCSVPARPLPTKRGKFQSALNVTTAAYKIFPDNSTKLVPSEVKVIGGGSGPGQDPEWVVFYMLIPLESAERDAEARRYLARLEKSIPQVKMSEEARQHALERLREFVYQQRLGHFRVECRVLDGDRMMGVGVIEFEVLFKGRFSDFGLLVFLRLSVFARFGSPK